MKNLYLFFMALFYCSQLFAQMEHDIESGRIGEEQRFITLQGFAISSIGESTEKWKSFKESWKSATGLYIGYVKVYPSDWALVYQTGYFSFKHNEQADFEGDPSYTVIPLVVGGRYYIVRHLFQPYLLAMTGINIISEKYTLEGKATDKNSARLHFQVGAGVGLNITNSLGIEINGKYNSHTLDASVPYNMTGLEYGLAVNWILGP